MSHRPLVVIAGPPNAGKTTLFNALSGRRAKVGNYPGITVERREARVTVGAGATASTVDLVDLPGTYSLLAHTGEEQIALEAILGLRGNREPDAVIICVDATQVTRGWYLVLQALEHGVRVIVALTMIDEAGPSAPKTGELARCTGCPVVATAARHRAGIDRLRETLAQVLGDSEPPEALWRWTPSSALAERLATTRQHLPPNWPDTDAMALWALMSIDDEDELSEIDLELRQCVSDLVNSDERGQAIDDEVIEGRYEWIDREIAPLLEGVPDRTLTDRIDQILLHRLAGFAVFLGAMFIVFQALFAWSDPAITVIEETFAWFAGWLESQLPAGILSDFLVNGLIAGIGSVVVFLPQILLLFFFIGVMEDTGYLARVAYLMDRIMRSMNLHGRAFVPMLSGFACAVPAILATRTMERRRDRLLTMMVVPLMTCSARLPVYTLVIAALFPAGHVLGIVPIQGLLMVFMYLFSTMTALAAAWVLSRTVKPLRATRLPFVIELPPYRLPRLGDVVRMMWERSRVFLTEAGTVILVCTAILWFLLSFPRPTAEQAPVSSDDVQLADAQRSDGQMTDMKPADVQSAASAESELLRDSYGGRLGRAIEPAIAPLGFDWKLGVGIIGAFAAREVFISTMGVLYSAGGEVDESSATLRQRMRDEVRQDGRPAYTPLVGLSLMIFFALACQCMSTLAVVRRETASYRWPIFLFMYMTALAWLASLLVYQGGRLLGFA